MLARVLFLRHRPLVYDKFPYEVSEHRTGRITLDLLEVSGFPSLTLGIILVFSS
jgi:hypothetical protein